MPSDDETGVVFLCDAREFVRGVPVSYHDSGRTVRRMSSDSSPFTLAMASSSDEVSDGVAGAGSVAFLRPFEGVREHRRPPAIA